MAYDEHDYKVDPAGPPCTPSNKGYSGNPRGRFGTSKNRRRRGSQLRLQPRMPL